MHTHKMLIAATMLGVLASGVIADSFGTGVNQFTIDFLQISGDASSANGTLIGGGATGFVDPGDFGIGKYEITNDQWTKFVNMAGAPTGFPGSAYNAATTGGANLPGINVSAFEGFQFVNWLNITSGYGAAYKFVETTPGDPLTLTFGVWTPAEAAGGTNLFRHKDAYYFIPTEDEWVKAAYWNSGDPSNLQTYASVGDVVPVENVDSQYNSFAYGLWDVGTGTKELNGTYDMMGNAKEFTESPGMRDGVYDPSGVAGTPVRGGCFSSLLLSLTSSKRGLQPKHNEQWNVGFRVAAIQGAPEFDPGDFDLDGDIDDIDIDTLCDFIRGGLPYDLLYDVSGPGEDGVPDGLVDTNDLNYHVHALVETSVGNGTEYGDFNLDGLVDTTDLTRLATNYGADDWGWDDGNANRYIDTDIDNTDLTILATYYGFIASVDAIPEPATLSLLALGGLVVLRRQRRQLKKE